MIAALRAAGFVGVEAVGEVIHARLSGASAEFTADPVAGGWRLAMTWPVRASAAQIAGWNTMHPEAPMDIWQGETRIVMQVGADTAALLRWAALAEAMVAACIRWRRAQRSPGEGN